MLFRSHENVYVIHIDKVVLNVESCLIANDVNDSWLWHRRPGHDSMKTLSKLVKNDLIIGLPKLSFDKDKIVMHVNLENKLETLLNKRT